MKKFFKASTTTAALCIGFATLMAATDGMATTSTHLDTNASFNGKMYYLSGTAIQPSFDRFGFPIDTGKYTISSINKCKLPAPLELTIHHFVIDPIQHEFERIFSCNYLQTILSEKNSFRKRNLINAYHCSILLKTCNPN